MAGGHQRLKFKEDVEKLRLGEMIGDELILIARGRRRITRLVTSSSGTSGCCPTRPMLAVWKPWPMVREGGGGGRRGYRCSWGLLGYSWNHHNQGSF